MQRMAYALVLALLLPCALAAQSDPEQFDRTGMPPRPTTFLEQQIAEAIAAHKAGDLVDATLIQKKLARYYASVGDGARAREAEARAVAADGAPSRLPAAGAPVGAPPPRPVATPAGAPVTSPPASAARKPTSSAGAFSGRFYAMVRGSLESYEFASDGTYLYRHVAGGSATHASTSERGTYTVSGGTIALTPTREAVAYGTASVGGRGSLIGGGSDAGAPARRVPFRLLGTRGSGGMQLGGVTFRVKSW